MAVASTSRYALDRIKSKLGKRQEQVYIAIANLGTATNEAIADYLGVPINYVTGRVFELRKYGVVGNEGLGKNRSGMAAKLWSIRDPNDKELEEIASDCGD